MMGAMTVWDVIVNDTDNGALDDDPFVCTFIVGS